MTTALRRNRPARKLSVAAPPAPRPIVLVVDDTPENLSVVGELLQSYCRVRIANSGARALRIAAADPQPDLILLDVMMPGLDGYEVLRRLRREDRTRDIPVIFVTALDAMDAEVQGLGLGAVDFIAKPVNPLVLDARVRTQLELKRARDRMRDDNAWLDRELARRRAENQRLQDVSLRALSGLAATRDNETGNHLRRTQAYVRLLCELLVARGRYPELLTPDGIRHITEAAPLHDIGKVGIPDRILLKPGKLDAAEWEVMRTHAALGAQAIRDAIAAAGVETGEPAPGCFEHLQAAIDIAHYHHERWDGTGYPEALAGPAIPLPARLMAVADVYDALISRRPYKEPFPVAEAERMLAEAAGSHLDPELVDLFLQNRSAFAAIAAGLADHADQQPQPAATAARF